MTTTLGLRPAGPRDLPAVDSVISRSFGRLLPLDYPPSIVVLAVPLLARAQPGLMRCPTYFVVEDAGRIVGAGGWTARDPHTGRTADGAGHIRAFATDPEYLRRGVGRLVMAEVLRTARIAGVRRLTALSTRTAVPFYAALGFRPVGETEVSLRPGIGFPVTAMRRG